MTDERSLTGSVTRIGKGRTAKVVIASTLLRQLYIEQEKSTVEIGKMMGVSKKTIRLLLAENGIERRSLKDAFSVSTTHQKAVKRRGELHGSWRGGTRKNCGYVMVYSPEHPNATAGYVMQHRLVMEQYLGRLLERHEEVHHKNESRSDNRIENLELMTKSEHMRHHATLRHEANDPTFGFKKAVLQ